ncbi:unnamed protein product [Polarella glacialis]|uniref:U-box domain-containing protein n=1 Tax=Polarella glacialis TaxID=89957 RepID=A0A813L894_POLGL|nr:unnamed protein product [Polarella glacialis]
MYRRRVGGGRMTPPRVLNLSANFEPSLVATALARLWTVHEWKLSPVRDAKGEFVDTCPISLERMKDPVLLCDGQVYERDSILQWLSSGRNDSPCTREEFQHQSILELMPMHAVIDSFLDQCPTRVQPSGREQLERCTQDAATAMNSSMVSSETQQALRVLDSSIAVSVRGIRDWQASVQAAQEISGEYEKMRSRAAQRIQASLRTFACQLELVRLFAEEQSLQQIRAAAAATRIQTFRRSQLKHLEWKSRCQSLAELCTKAILAGQTEMVQLFLRKEGFVNYQAIVHMLRASGAQMDAQVLELTPLHVAARDGNSRIVRLLCAAGADKDMPNSKDDWAPLHFAVANGHLEVVIVLLAAGANIGSISRWSLSFPATMTPLFLAFHHGHSDIAGFLFQAGAWQFEPVRSPPPNWPFGYRARYQHVQNCMREHDMSCRHALLCRHERIGNQGSCCEASERGDDSEETNFGCGYDCGYDFEVPFRKGDRKSGRKGNSRALRRTRTKSRQQEEQQRLRAERQKERAQCRSRQSCRDLKLEDRWGHLHLSLEFGGHPCHLIATIDMYIKAGDTTFAELLRDTTNLVQGCGGIASFSSECVAVFYDISEGDSEPVEPQYVWTIQLVELVDYLKMFELGHTSFMSDILFRKVV